MNEENKQNRKLTTNQGVPISDNQNSRTAGPNGPTLLEDYQLLEKIAHFDRERIPERVVHARGMGAHGVFKTKNSMKKYTTADFLSEEGKETPLFARFSTVIHGKHSPETARDPRGFSVKFYTEEGNYDFVGNTLPVFFIRDAIKFPDVIHSLKPDPVTNVQDPARYWDFMSLSPESTNMMLHLFTDEGIPANYRQMRGSSVHAFKWYNENNEIFYVKQRWQPKEGIKNLSMDEAQKVQGESFNHATVDLYNAIEKGEYPEWDLYIQVLRPEELDSFDFNPLDATKDWLEEDVPWEHVGTMTLNRNVDNFFEETEQVSFNPGVLVPGMMPSEDKMLQGRLFSYSDTQRHRVGPNYLNLPINKPKVEVNNYQQEGFMNSNSGIRHVNYEPNSGQGEPGEAKGYQNPSYPIEGEADRQLIDKVNHYGQAGRIYRSFSQDQKDQLFRNLMGDFDGIEDRNIVGRAIANFYYADEELGKQLAEKANIDLEQFVGQSVQ
ncbi:catalase [Pontibacillus halophilus JSM 076056 = DSM 19796]|uniref:catalase n=1 Tax=Pontibacillus halophilus JSM 076056 = DSM 19796 TaxID=1385510 RepID=A0A0A5GJ13_9BACI|nr:catalase [Pontibacillus halophilus]KGX91984.1 catalase [Pontibacillus halophilus JSM 076056 = DSM 19796]